MTRPDDGIVRHGGFTYAIDYGSVGGDWTCALKSKVDKEGVHVLDIKFCEYVPGKKVDVVSLF